MVWWQVLILVAATAFVAGVAGYRNGTEHGELMEREANERTNRHLDADDALFGSEPSVRAAEEQFVHAMPEAVILVDAEGGILYMGKGVSGFGLVDGTRIGDEDAVGILSRVVADGKSREREIAIPLDMAHDGVIPGNSGHGVQAGETMPASTRYLKLRVSAIGDDRYAIFVSDMSEQRRFEAMRRDFMTNVSHELKTPAGAISLLAETIGDAADDPDAVRYFAGRVAKESTRLTELVHRLIDLQKAQDAGGVLDARRLSVMAVARKAIAENQVQADGRHIAIDLSFGGEPAGAEPAEGEPDAFVSCDEESIVTAVKNLVENAIHYSPEHTTVRVAVTANDTRVKIRVIDQGIGIPAASIDRIFERFYRVDPARSRQTGGTGLGLAIVKHSVADCGGTVSVWSREGEGSTFTIELPRDVSGDDDASADGGASGASDASRKGDDADGSGRERPARSVRNNVGDDDITVMVHRQ
ncbi:sensor histidine kinase [Bifidobacterium saguinibicoloris]|uniref:sensor histidine kinase n=1 Tax=Bifidobacterium saguinibicoloris TaxID=2834433 RepID=UPI001F3513D1|nr:ATP-binding protein [Bifidobacterium saguinibicoloris]